MVDLHSMSHWGDLLAIPGFALLIYYFYNLEEKTILEYLLLLFSITALILDILFTYEFLCLSKRRSK